MNKLLKYTCPNCGNTNPIYFGIKNGQPYCRLCIAMVAKEKVGTTSVESNDLSLNYPLTFDQERVSEQVLLNYIRGINTLIYAVTGAGKTELVYKVIQYALEKKQTVGFAIPRRQVVLELKDRIQKAFKNNTVIAVFGGNHDNLEADIITLTTHQLFRYQDYFDLLILDEIDAFPFLDNELLNNMFFKAVKGNYVLMSATPNEDTLNYFKKDGHDIVYLNKRYHNHPLPTPSLVIASGYTKYIYLIRTIKRMILNNKKVFIFCPTIDKAEKTFMIVSKFIKRGNLVHSKIPNQPERIFQFRNGLYDYLVTTAVLERGVTVKGLQVIVLDADSEIYDKYSLIQIAGRSGRNFQEPEGEVIFIASKETNDISNAIETISNYNQNL